MPLIRVEMFAGRTREQKRELAKELTEAYVRVCGGTPQGITLLMEDVSKENWSAGGELMCDKYPDKA